VKSLHGELVLMVQPLTVTVLAEEPVADEPGMVVELETEPPPA
jgi:hypothetical protein